MKLFQDESGAVTVDWVVLAGSLVLLAGTVVLAVGNATESAASLIEDTTSDAIQNPDQ